MAEKVNSGRSFLPPEFVVASPCLTESPVGLFLLESQRANPIHQPLNRRDARNKDDNCANNQKRIHRAPPRRGQSRPLWASRMRKQDNSQTTRYAAIAWRGCGRR